MLLVALTPHQVEGAQLELLCLCADVSIAHLRRYSSHT